MHSGHFKRQASHTRTESNKSQLHSDAKRLFQKDTDDDENWESHYDGTYRTRLQGVKHAKRDGTAFASVALPAHYPAIFAVFDHVKRRLGPSWSVEQVIDWGAGTGSGLWLVKGRLPSLLKADL